MRGPGKGNHYHRARLGLCGAGAAFTWADALLVQEGEIDLGGTIILPADVTVRRADQGYEVLTNVPIEGTILGEVFALQPSANK